MFPTSKKSKKKIFLTPLTKSKNFENSKIFNNIGSHDGLKKKITKIGQKAANHIFFYSPCSRWFFKLKSDIGVRVDDWGTTSNDMDLLWSDPDQKKFGDADPGQ